MVAVSTGTVTDVTASERIVIITGPPTNAVTVNGPPRRATVMILIRPRFPRLLFGGRLLGIDRGDATEAHGTAL